MRYLKVLLTIGLLVLSGCAIVSSNAQDIAGNAASVEGPIKVNASETVNGIDGAQCDTEYNEKSGGRAHNIKLAAGKLNGYEIGKGQIFSFNEALGSTGKKDGYKKARIFVLGKDAEGYGGGICQLSSALYNCALDMELDIVERHPHSKPVGYVPENRDAATSYGGKDLKFENNSGKTLKILSTAKDGVLSVKLVGE